MTSARLLSPSIGDPSMLCPCIPQKAIYGSSLFADETCHGQPRRGAGELSIEAEQRGCGVVGPWIQAVVHMFEPRESVRVGLD